MRKFRLLRRTYVGGGVIWIIQKQHPWYTAWLFGRWEYVDSVWHERNALERLAQLRNGVPLQLDEELPV